MCTTLPEAAGTFPLVPRVQGRQTLLFDADDTLWENNIYFERAIQGFVQLVDHSTLSHEEVLSAFNALEHERVKSHGYGTNSFRQSMLASLHGFRGRDCTEAERSRIHDLTHAIVAADIELLPDVEGTLQTLHARHALVLMTKGEPAEQTDKLQRSGLAPLFAHVEVVREKHREAYLDLHSRHRLDAGTTWMIGNSPKSDINPAIAAGLHAIFVPHANTWVLEHEAVAAAPQGRHLLVLDRFSQLAEIF